MSRIAIDAMGGDYAPRAIVEGAVWAAQEYGVGLELVGRQEDIQAELDRIKAAGCVYSDCGTKGHKRRIKIDLDKIDYNNLLMLQKLLAWVKLSGNLFVRKKIPQLLHQSEQLQKADVKLLYQQVLQVQLWQQVYLV